MSAFVEVLGIRHHGPGSARAVLAALERIHPDAVLVEGPVDAGALVPWIAHPAMQPPVALLAHQAGEPEEPVFWPFAEFSPEWQALRWALDHEVAAGFCDLPSGVQLAARQAGDAVPDLDSPATVDPATVDPIAIDPIAALARAGGHEDPERWWEDLVERSAPGEDPFTVVLAAMSAVRSEPVPQLDARREAHMRREVRRRWADGAGRVAVVCGAWHAPALAAPFPPAAADAGLLRGLPRRQGVLTWVPWSHSRLAQASGYGAGVMSPGWYAHLFSAPDRPAARWLVRVARELRTADLPVATGHVVEALRLAEALAALRGRRLPGLDELTEATRAALCDGDELRLRLVTERLVIGERLGTVPDGIPGVPLVRDLAATARRLRLARTAEGLTLDLDLRRATDRARSHLLHRLIVLGVPWGTPRESSVRGTGTFRESWTLRWYPELAAALIEASPWGTTVEDAARARLVGQAARSGMLAEVTAAVERCLLADLPGALPELLASLDRCAAGQEDVAALMDAVPALVRAVRYGDVRGTDPTPLVDVADALLARVFAGLPVAVGRLDDHAAGGLRRRVDAVHDALALRAALPGGAAMRERWHVLLAELAARRDLHGVIAGRFVRLLFDAGRLDASATGDHLARALSPGTPVTTQAAWVEGFLGGGGLLLAHDAELFALVDHWLTGLSAQEFVDVLPLLRRAASSFATGQRRLVAERAARAVLPPGSRSPERRCLPRRIAALVGAGHDADAAFDTAVPGSALDTGPAFDTALATAAVNTVALLFRAGALATSSPEDPR